MFSRSTTRLTLVAIISLSLVSIGCGDDGDGGPSGFSTSVDQSSELGGLSDADETQLCEDMKGYQEQNTPSKEKSCEALAIGLSVLTGPETDEELQAACNQNKEECLNGELSDNDDDEDSCESFDESCDATVGDYVSCQEALLTQQLEGLETLPSCDSVTLDYLQNNTDSGDDRPAACDTYDTKCGDGGSGSGDTGEDSTGGM